MAVSPLAMAEQSKKIGKETILQALKEMGALDNKNITMGEVWKKVRHKFPAYIQSQLDLPFSVYKDEKIPQFELNEVKNSQGEAVVALNIKDGGDTARIEFPGKDSEFMKFNGIGLSEQDIANPNRISFKLKDEKIAKKDFEKYEKNLAKRSVFPTYEQWNKMTPYLRASFMVEFRRMMKEVETILNIENSRNVKTSALDFPFLRLVLGEEACAAGAKERDCIIGGNTGKIIPSKSLVCTLGERKDIDPQYTNGCDQTGKYAKISCNPMLYGYDRQKGGRICFDYNVKDTQTTLHATSKVCEAKSPLTKPQETYELIKSVLKSDENMSEKDIKALFIESEVGGEKKFTYGKGAWEKLWAENGVFKRFETAKVEAERVCKPILDQNRKTVKGSKDTYNPKYEAESTRQQSIACETLRKRSVAIFDFIENIAQRDDKAPATDGKTDDCDEAATPVPVVVRDDKTPPNNLIPTLPVERSDEKRPATRMVENTTGTRVICTTVTTASAGSGEIDTSDDAPLGTRKDTKEKAAAGGFWSGVKDFFGGPWGKTILFGGLLGGMIFGTVWGLKRLLKRKDPVYTAPASSPGVITAPVTPGPATPIEGGAGTSPATAGGVR